MIYKKRILILTILVVITLQVLLNINNNQKSSFRYFIWNIEEIRIGKLISISFISGLLISTILNKTISSNLINNSSKDVNENDEDYDVQTNDENNASSFEIPPQRDIRDTQPTISVNYRIIKNTGENNPTYDENNSNNQEYQDDWINNNNKDW